MDNFQWEDDVRYRFENTEEGHFKFYEITLTEVDLQNGLRPIHVLHTAYGSLTPRAHITHIKSNDFATRHAAETEMNKIINKRLSHGYKEVK